MNDLRFQSHADFLACLEVNGLEQAFSELVRQLEESFQPALLDSRLIQAFDADTLKQYQLLPLLHAQGILHMGTIQPTEEFQAFLQKAFGCPVQLSLISTTLFERFNSSLTGQILVIPQEAGPSVAQVFQRLLEQAQKLRASDIHLEPQYTASVLVRFRIDGLLHDIETLESSEFDYRTRLVSKIKVAADLDIAETRVPQDGRITEQINGEPVDLRVSTLPSMHGEKIVIRLLPHKNPFQEMRELGLEGEALITYYNWVKKPQGMVLITGQTGSGKTSTLYTTLSQIVQPEKNIITIEDPIEYKLAGVTQVQVHPKVGLTFANGLRSILRQDPDIILLGEIRDQETAEIAYQAALTGHLVLSTLHTNDAPSAIIRLMDMNVEPYLIASATLGVVAQRLLRKVCPHCAQPYTPAQDLLREFGLSRHDDHTFYKAVGCEQCFNTGYYGREGIFEVMPVDDELTALIQQKEQLPFIRSHLQGQKIQSLFESALSKIQKGLTTVEEVHRVIPPTQRKAAPGSVFVFMLFLISILSILVLNGFSMFEDSTQTLRMEKQSIQGSYAAHSALQVGKKVLGERLKADYLYFLPIDNKSDNPLLAVPELASFFTETGKISLDELEGQYQLSVKPTRTEKHRLVQVLEYGYQVLAKGVLNSKDNQSIAPMQRVSGDFQVQTGPLPLSYFERFTASGSLTLPDETPAGPWYSPELPVEPSESLLPQKGYYTQADYPFGKELAGLKANQHFQLPPSLWPEIGDPAVEQSLNPTRPSVYLTPIARGLGRSYQVLPVIQEVQEDVFKPDTSPWAISVYGNVDRLSLKAGSDSQFLEIDQIDLGKSAVQNGYQSLILYKTLIDVDQGRKRVEVTVQKWQITLNPQRYITKQKLESATRQVWNDQFSGLIQVNGSINQIVAEGFAYSRPLSIFSTNDIGIAGSIQKYPSATKAALGLVTAEGRIAFHLLQPPPIADWAPDKTKDTEVQAALAAGSLALPENASVTVKGSVAILKSGFPSGLKTEFEPTFYSLSQAPPYFPTLNPDSLALMITRPPGKEHWETVGNP